MKYVIHKDTKSLSLLRMLVNVLRKQLLYIIIQGAYSLYYVRKLPLCLIASFYFWKILSYFSF